MKEEEINRQYYVMSELQVPCSVNGCKVIRVSDTLSRYYARSLHLSLLFTGPSRRFEVELESPLNFDHLNKKEITI